jgi:hypothetical protein
MAAVIVAAVAAMAAAAAVTVAAVVATVAVVTVAAAVVIAARLAKAAMTVRCATAVPTFPAAAVLAADSVRVHPAAVSAVRARLPVAWTRPRKWSVRGASRPAPVITIGGVTATSRASAASTTTRTKPSF